jgi:hypothetical protein
MALLKLPQIRSDGVEYIDQRSLYFNKYMYRARVYSVGMYLISWNLTREDMQIRINSNQRRLSTANADQLLKFSEWKNSQLKGNNRICTIRIEGDVASVFSNDLTHLKTLETIGCVVDYTEIGDDIPLGVKYFVNEPKYKHRIHLKSKRVSEDFPNKLAAMVERYKGTGTKIAPCPSLKEWLSTRGVPSLGGWLAWKRSYCSSHYFIDYNDESFITLFALSFDNMISRKYNLKKRPEST